MEMLPDREIEYPGVVKLSPWTFSNGVTVPIFDIQTVHALNYIVGHAKRINKDECSVYSRGQGRLYKNLRPSLYRGDYFEGDVNPLKFGATSAKLDGLIGQILSEETLCANLGFPKGSPPPQEHVEAMLQHYGVPTRMLDAVDNHWIALWFGLYECTNGPVGGSPYALYRKRRIHGIDVAEKYSEIKDEAIYQYILLIATPKSDTEPIKTYDLRLDLPPRFMRPHAQHGVMIDNSGMSSSNPSRDYSQTIVGILRIRIDRAALWIGSGHLLSYANLFPSHVFDKGYAELLRQTDLFAGFGWPITEYVYDVD